MTHFILWFHHCLPEVCDLFLIWDFVCAIPTTSTLPTYGWSFKKVMRLYVVHKIMAFSENEYITVHG
jgi:hypothetical protein